MIRRVHVQQLHVGSVALPPTEAHHIRDVLRLTAGTTLELFDDLGQTATAVISSVSFANVVAKVESINAAPMDHSPALIVASAIPKGDRADWMIEKLTELGVARFIPLVAERSVVVPGGKNKIDRWERTAIESAKQSRRAGIMAIGEVIALPQAIKGLANGWYLSTAENATPIHRAIQPRSKRGNDPFMTALTLFVGPEGGWSPAEIELFAAAGIPAIRLTPTILRVETAAIAAATVVLCAAASHYIDRADEPGLPHST